VRNESLTLLRQNVLALLHRPGDAINSQIATVLAGHGLRLVVGLFSSALLARGLGPAGLSIFSVLSAVMLIAGSVSDFGLGQSAVRHVAADAEKRPEIARELTRTYVSLKLLAILLVFTAGWLLAAPISEWLQINADNGLLLVRLGVLGVAATTLSGIVATLLQSLRRFAVLMATQSLNIILTLLLMALLYFTGRLTVANALLVGLGTALVMAAAGAWGIPAGWRSALLPARRPPATGIRRLWNFGRWLWLATMLSILVAQLDLLLVNSLTNPLEAGYYALALNLALKAGVVHQTLHLVLLPQVSALSGRAQFAIYARRSLLRGLALAFLLLPGFLLARPFILLVYGTEFGPAVPLFQFLLVAVIFDLLVEPLLLLAYPLDMPKVIAASHAIQVAALFVGGSLLIPAWGGAGAVAAKSLAKVLGALFMGSLLWLRVRQQAGEPVNH